MKKHLILLLLIPVIITAQNQSIELPEFVITGVQSVSVPEMEKETPELISSLSEEFYKPKAPPSNFLISGFDNPVLKGLRFERSPFKSYGMIKAGFGTQTQPDGEFQYHHNSAFLLLSGFIKGSKIKDFEPFSDFTYTGAGIAADFFVEEDSDFLPGLKIKTDAAYDLRKYYLFASPVPDREREIQRFNGGILLTQDFLDIVNFKIDFDDTYRNVKDLNYKENFINLDLAVRINLYDFSLYLNGGIEAVNSDFDGQNAISTNLAYGGGGVFFKPSKHINLKVGADYYNHETGSLFAPQASISIMFAENVTIFGEYSPKAYLTSTGKLIDENNYLSTFNGSPMVEEYFNAKAAIRYAYDKYFEINGGIRLSKIDNFYFFADNTVDGRFDVYFANEVSVNSIFVNFFFHPGPLGSFYAEANYETVETDQFTPELSGNQLPYQPKLKLNASYNYLFSSGLSLNASVIAINESFSDFQNQEKLPSYLNAGFGIGFRFSDNFKLAFGLHNLLNKELYLWQDYKEKPFDAVFSAEYNF